MGRGKLLTEGVIMNKKAFVLGIVIGFIAVSPIWIATISTLKEAVAEPTRTISIERVMPNRADIPEIYYLESGEDRCWIAATVNGVSISCQR